MNLSQSSWMAELTQSCLETMRRESEVSTAAWEITQDPATAVSLARIAGKLYRIVTFESLGGGFSLRLLSPPVREKPLRAKRKKRKAEPLPTLPFSRRISNLLLLRGCPKSLHTPSPRHASPPDACGDKPGRGPGS